MEVSLLYFFFFARSPNRMHTEQKAANGQPRCSAGETCLFQSINGMKLGGCAKPGISYDWITGKLDSHLRLNL